MISSRCTQNTVTGWSENILQSISGNQNEYEAREMVKTIVLRQDPPLRKKTGGLFM